MVWYNTITTHCVLCIVAGDVIPGEDDAAEDGGGWDVGDDLELPTDLVSCCYYDSLVLVVYTACYLYFSFYTYTHILLCMHRCTRTLGYLL